MHRLRFPCSPVSQPCNPCKTIPPTVSPRRLENRNFWSYGIVLEGGGVFLDQSWFDGTGYAITSTPIHTDIPILTHEISWDDEFVVHAAWSSMPLDRSYCHKANHSHLDCPVRKAIHSWSCLSAGHVLAHCPKRGKPAPIPASTSTSGASKKSVRNTPETPVTPATKRSPSSSDSETDQPSPTRPPP